MSSSISSSSSPSCSSLSSAALGSKASPACSSQSIPMALDVLSQGSQAPQSSSLAAYDVSVVSIAPAKPAEFIKPLTRQFIQRLEPLFNFDCGKKPISLEIFNSLTLKEFINLAYLKMISGIMKVNTTDLYTKLMLLVRSLSEEDPDFNGKIQEIKDLTKNIIGLALEKSYSPYKEFILDELPTYRKTLEYLLGCRAEYKFKMGPPSNLEQENQLKVIYYVLEMMESGFDESETYSFDVVLQEINLPKYSYDGEREFFTLNLIGGSLSEKIGKTLEHPAQLSSIDQLLDTAEAYKMRTSRSLHKAISDMKIAFITLAKVGLIPEGDASFAINAMKENHLIIANRFSQFYQSFANEVEKLIPKYKNIEGLTGSILWKAISTLLLDVHKRIFDQGTKQLEKKGKRVSSKNIPKKGKAKGNKQKEKIEKKESHLFPVQSPEYLSLERDLREIFEIESSRLFSWIFSFIKKIPIPESLEVIKHSLNESGLSSAICQTIPTLFFQSSSSPLKLDTIQELVDLLNKASKVSSQQINYHDLMKEALEVSLSRICSPKDVPENFEKIQSLYKFIEQDLKERRHEFLRFQVFYDLFFQQLKILRNSNDFSDHLSWMEWIDADDEIVEKGRKKARREAKVDESEEDEEVESLAPVSPIYASSASAAAPSLIPCDTTSIVTVVDSLQRLISHFYGLENLVPSQSSSKLSRQQIAQRQQIYALNAFAGVLKALNHPDSDPRVQERLLSEVFHLGHMAIEQGATAHYLFRHPNRLNIPHNINQLLADFGCNLRNRWTDQSPSASLYFRYPFSFEHRANSPLALRHIASPQPNTLREASPQQLRLWAIDLVRTHLNILERTLPAEKKGDLKAFKKDFDLFAHAPAQACAIQSKHSLIPHHEALIEAERIFNESMHRLRDYLSHRHLPQNQRQSLENALHHLKSLSEQPNILRRLPEQEYLSLHGHRYLIATQYFAENIGMGLAYDIYNTQFTHDLSVIFGDLLQSDQLPPPQKDFLLSLNVFKGSEYVIKYFARLKQKGPEFSTMSFLDQLYSFASAGEGFTPHADKSQSKESLQIKLAEDIHKAAHLAHALVTLLTQPRQPGTPPRRSSGAASAAAVSEEKL